ncbi:MAG: hypothetical protein CVV64_18455, partial [Candidatus Wallbacteria bacterium HGW-Wallbacteria-1]
TQEEKTFISIYDGDDESHEYELKAELARNGHQKGYLNRHKSESRLDLVREFIGGPDADDLEHTRYGKISLAMLKDGLGSTIALTGREGKAIARIGYDAWGNFRWSDNDKHSSCKDDECDSYLNRLENTRGFGNGNHNGWAFGKQFASKLTPYLYTGRRYSEITNQYFNRNRYYSPALGRFVSKDPIGFAADINLYRYVGNNPLIWVDPSGLFVWPEGAGTGIGLGIGTGAGSATGIGGAVAAGGAAALGVGAVGVGVLWATNDGPIPDAPGTPDIGSQEEPPIPPDPSPLSCPPKPPGKKGKWTCHMRGNVTPIDLSVKACQMETYGYGPTETAAANDGTRRLQKMAPRGSYIRHIHAIKCWKK